MNCEIHGAFRNPENICWGCEYAKLYPVYMQLAAERDSHEKAIIALREVLSKKDALIEEGQRQIDVFINELATKIEQEAKK